MTPAAERRRRFLQALVCRAAADRAGPVAVGATATAMAAVTATVPLLAGCGFKLRQPPRLGFSTIALTGFAPRSPLAQELTAQLAQQVRLLAASERADVVLQALEDVRERSVVASTAAAQVRELQLRVRLVFRAATPAGRELIPRSELVLSRDLSYSETAALAKEEEEAEVFRDMQADLVGQVLRRLAAVSV